MFDCPTDEITLAANVSMAAAAFLPLYVGDFFSCYISSALL